MDHQDHYAEAFCPLVGRCFRLVTSGRPGSERSPHHCHTPVASFGRFRDAQGRLHDVEACSVHDGDLAEAFPVNRR